MKVRFVFLVVFCVCCFGALAQTKTIPAPETLNEICYYKKVDNTHQSLEKGRASFMTKAKAMGFGGASTNYVLDGEKSTMRLPQQDSLSFIVSMPAANGEPSAWFSLFKADIKKGKRSGNYINSKVLTVKSKSGNGIIAFTVKHLGNNVYQIIPSERLRAGEYFFINRGTMGNYGGQGADAFAFGVD